MHKYSLYISNMIWLTKKKKKEQFCNQFSQEIHLLFFVDFLKISFCSPLDSKIGLILCLQN